MCSQNHLPCCVGHGGDLREVFRIIGRQEAVKYAKEYVERHRRIQQFTEDYVRKLAEAVPSVGRPEPPKRKPRIVELKDAVEAIEHCRSLRDKADAKRRPDVSLTYDALCERYPGAPRTLIARAVLDVAGSSRGRGLLALSWRCAADDGVTIEQVTRHPPLYSNPDHPGRLRQEKRAAELLEQRLGQTGVVVSVDIEASVEMGNTRPMVHAVAWCSDRGGTYYSLVAPSSDEAAAIREAGIESTRVGLFGKFIRTPADLSKLEAEGRPIASIAADFELVLRPETHVLAALVGFNIAQDLARLGPPGGKWSTSAVVVCDVMLSGPRKMPSGQWMRLSDMCDHCGVKHEAAHDARGDARSALLLYTKLSSDAGGGGMRPTCVCAGVVSTHTPPCPLSIIVRQTH
jgi:hypothetical protein